MPMSSKPLPAAARAERYREFAAHTLKLAQSTQAHEIKATYLSLAQCWKSLADQAERLSSEFPDEPGEDEASPSARPLAASVRPPQKA